MIFNNDVMSKVFGSFETHGELMALGVDYQIRTVQSTPRVHTQEIESNRENE